MTDFLLELRSEEIPARMQAKARNDLARLFAECTSAAGLSTGAVDAHSTPRRLVLIVRDVAESTKAAREELKGPRTNAPEQALEGFLRKTGLKREQLEDRDGVLFAVIERPGKAAADVLAETVKRIVTDLPWPKSMRWGDGGLRWVRPLHGIVAILGEDIIPVEIDGIASSATTFGHRFHHPGPITIGGAHDYAEKLRACHVIVDQDERERLIREGAAAVAREAGLALIEDEGLVVENAGLTEWPVPLIGRFDDDFLDVPREVIVLTMRTNQKYFACTNDEGLLAPAFICVANVDSKDGGKAIAQGNARVLAARLADARFFWEQDVKIPLEEQARKLDGIVFHEKLGTVADKVERVARLARWLVEEGIVKGAKPDQVERAARLAKADLVSGMVGEFPELQGVIGGYLAEAQGQPKAVVEAIRDHYKPVGQGDEVPTSPATVAVSLADKLDTLLSFYTIGEVPTGSKDPFALRRAAIGSIALILANNIRVSLLPLFMAMFQERVAAFQTGFMGNTPQGVLLLLADRLKVQQREAGVRHDLIDSVFALGSEDDLIRLLARVKALQEFVGTEDGTNLLVAYKRAANILKKEKWEGTGASGGSDLAAEEKALIDALDKAEPKAAAAIGKEDFTGAMAALAFLRKPIDSFFDHVTVNDPDKAKRERRLNLLLRFRDAVNAVADFSRIEG
ncbi:MAG TPA: glycine--tRNA ligase subunit beta [Sphingomicrobium sp.]|nr:glycine--tRNA ligase subunit beta [Sphingomicrobium sp.]